VFDRTSPTLTPLFVAEMISTAGTGVEDLAGDVTQGEYLTAF
jgi:hypothetical protein